MFSFGNILRLRNYKVYLEFNYLDRILELNDKSTNKTQNDKSPVIVEPTEDEFGVLDYLGFGEDAS